MSDIKYPNVQVDLVGEDGNAFSILGRVQAAMRREGISKEECDAFFAEATAADYDHLLATVMKWVNVGEEMDEEDEDEDDHDDIWGEGELDSIFLTEDEDEGDDYGYATQRNFD